jgi:hypothetical protein
MGQTGRSFCTRFQENLRDFKYVNGRSTFAKHLLENRHAIGPMEEMMDTIHFTSKGRLVNTLEKFYIFRETKLNNQINEKLTVKPNIIFDTIVQHDPQRGIHNAHSTQYTNPYSVGLECYKDSHKQLSPLHPGGQPPPAWVCPPPHTLKNRLQLPTRAQDSTSLEN